jgi:hypothetical protein
MTHAVAISSPIGGMLFTRGSSDRGLGLVLIEGADGATDEDLAEIGVRLDDLIARQDRIDAKAARAETMLGSIVAGLHLLVRGGDLSAA